MGIQVVHLHDKMPVDTLLQGFKQIQVNIGIKNEIYIIEVDRKITFIPNFIICFELFSDQNRVDSNSIACKWTTWIAYKCFSHKFMNCTVHCRACSFFSVVEICLFLHCIGCPFYLNLNYWIDFRESILCVCVFFCCLNFKFLFYVFAFIQAHICDIVFNVRCARMNERSNTTNLFENNFEYERNYTIKWFFDCSIITSLFAWTFVGFQKKSGRSKHTKWLIWMHQMNSNYRIR